MRKIKIEPGQKSYDVIIGKGIFRDVRKELGKRKLTTSRFIVADKRAYEYNKLLIDKTLLLGHSKGSVILFNSTEKNKNHKSLENLLTKMVSANINRDGIVIALGGGIVGDVAGFAASVYMRGIKYVQVPTTLLAAVDSSVGGKTGINLGSTKNIAGSFYQPELVIIDINFFKTLADEEIICGIGELVKYAFIINKNFYNYFNRNLKSIINLKSNVILKIIEDSVRYKGSVVAADEKEGSIRKILNLGHTFAHAIEVEQNYKIKHGQAVIIGISCAIELSYKMEFIDKRRYDKFINFILQFSSIVKLKNYNPDKLYQIMLRDKKNRMGNIKFVLIKDIGEILIDVEAKNEDVYWALRQGISIFIQK
ncbi:MAG: 3-dehydroquinate synthase [Melioribacteraceae bacterium]|nr:3-dehydroquinate synthase [Melioribacteraceae bacterium]